MMIVVMDVVDVVAVVVVVDGWPASSQRVLGCGQPCFAQTGRNGERRTLLVGRPHDSLGPWWHPWGDDETVVVALAVVVSAAGDGSFASEEECISGRMMWQYLSLLIWCSR